jgi:hypothetical protein
MSLLRTHGIEVSVSDEEFQKSPKGSFIIRMDQPYSRLADALLDIQYVRSDEKVYDDTGWTAGYLKNIDFKRVVTPDVLKVKMHAWDGSPAAAPTENNADTDYAKAWFKSHPAPRIALMHTWTRTQDEGWWRLALESLGIPYTYVSTQKVAAMPALRDQFDVIIFPPVGNADPDDIVNGYPPGPPLPWRKTAITPNLGGLDETDDMRPGLGLAGVQNIARFVDNGGLLITARDTSVWAVTYGLARWVQVSRTSKLRAPGTIVQTTIVDKKSPVAAGYDESLPMYFANNPVFTVGLGNRPDAEESRATGRGGKNDPDVPQGRPYVPLPEKPKPAPGEEGFQPPEDLPQNSDALMPRPEDRPKVIVSFAKPADKLLLSGMLDGGEELAGKPAVILAPRGKGNVLLFATNPMWRMNTQGTYALVTNALMSWDHLR